jgi:hypothetical protein
MPCDHFPIRCVFRIRIKFYIIKFPFTYYTVFYTFPYLLRTSSLSLYMTKNVTNWLGTGQRGLQHHQGDGAAGCGPRLPLPLIQLHGQ